MVPFDMSLQDTGDKWPTLRSIAAAAAKASRVSGLMCDCSTCAAVLLCHQISAMRDLCVAAPPDAVLGWPTDYGTARQLASHIVWSSRVTYVNGRRREPPDETPSGPGAFRRVLETRLLEVCLGAAMAEQGILLSGADPGRLKDITYANPALPAGHPHRGGSQSAAKVQGAYNTQTNELLACDEVKAAVSRVLEAKRLGTSPMDVYNDLKESRRLARTAVATAAVEVLKAVTDAVWDPHSRAVVAAYNHAKDVVAKTGELAAAAKKELCARFRVPLRQAFARARAATADINALRRHLLLRDQGLPHVALLPLLFDGTNGTRLDRVAWTWWQQCHNVTTPEGHLEADKLWGRVLECLVTSPVMMPGHGVVPPALLESAAKYSIKGVKTLYDHIVKAKTAMTRQGLTERVSACDRRHSGATRQFNDALGRLVSTARHKLQKRGLHVLAEGLKIKWTAYQTSRVTVRVATHLSRYPDLPAAIT